MAQSNLEFKQYSPEKPSYAARILESDWQRMRPIIDKLSKQGKSRRKVLEILDQSHDFHPSLAQLNARMVAWRYNVRRAVQPSSDAGEEHPTCTSTTLKLGSAVAQESVGRMDVDPVMNCCTKPGGEDMEHRAVHVVNKIRQLLLLAVTDAAYPTVSEESCFIHDIADLLIYTPGYAEYSYFLMQHLMNLVEDKSLTTTPTTRLVLLRDCLLWSRSWIFGIDVATWVFERFQKVVQEAHSTEYQRLKAFLSECREFGYSMWPGDIWWTDCPTLRPDEPSRTEVFTHSVVENPVLSSIQNLLVVEAGSKNKTNPLSEWRLNCLLVWCEKVVHEFTLKTPDRDAIGENCSATSIMMYCWTELMEHFVANWIQTARNHIPNTPPKGWPERHPAVSDFVLFKHTTRVLALVSYLAVQKAKKFILSRMASVCDANGPLRLCLGLRTILCAAVAELHSEQHEILEQIHQGPREWSYGSTMRDGSLEYLTGLLVLVVKEAQLLRQEPWSQRHQHTYLCLPGRSDMKDLVKVLGGSDPMLCDSSSTSSLQSFRRAGIKLKDRFGPMPMSGLSSLMTKCSVGSSIGVSKMISEEMQVESIM